MLYRISLLILILGVPAISAQGADAPDEISDNSGRITRGKVIRITDKEVFYKDTAGIEKTIKAENLIFIRSAAGEYRFFFNDEPAPESSADAKSAGRVFLVAGLVMHFADNRATGTYANDYGKALATKYNQQASPGGYSANLTRDASPVQWQFFIEPRLEFEKWILGLSIGYAALPKTAALVSSTLTSGEINITLSGMFFPVSAMVYYRLLKRNQLGINLGAGAGVLYSAISVNQEGGTGSGEQIFTSWSPMLALRPELVYQLGPVRLQLSLPFYWAESRDVTDGEVTLNKVNSTNILSPNLTGFGVSLAAGVKL